VVGFEALAVDHLLGNKAEENKPKVLVEQAVA
jgi:hypothetical protein